MISLEQALLVLDESLGNRPIESCDTHVRSADGHILRETVVSALDLPPFNKSIMDGYAVMADDIRDVYDVIEHIPAGTVPTLPLMPGQASMVMTGAPLPEGAGRVIIFEDTDRGEQRVSVRRHDERTNIALRGSRICRGDPVLEAGHRITPRSIAALLSCGVESIKACRPLRVAMITTGNEIVRSVDELRPGAIIDSNGPMLEAMCARKAWQLSHEEAVLDTLDQLTEAVRRSSRDADILLLSGGVSEGTYDFVPEALTQSGYRICFNRVAVRPGKPSTMAIREDCVAFGLPGNPVSAFVAFHMLVVRAARLLSGETPHAEPIRATLGESITRQHMDRTDLVPARIQAGNVVPVTYHGSDHLLALCHADGFLRIPVDVPELNAGDGVQFYPITGW